VEEKMIRLSVIDQVLSPGSTNLVWFLASVQILTYASLVPIFNAKECTAMIGSRAAHMRLHSLVQPASEKTIDENRQRGVGHNGGCQAAQLCSRGPQLALIAW
jgi:hypothetical protein